MGFLAAVRRPDENSIEVTLVCPKSGRNFDKREHKLQTCASKGHNNSILQSASRKSTLFGMIKVVSYHIIY
jgi:hypothetical protein